MRLCDTVAKYALPCMAYGSFKMCKISLHISETMSMCRRTRACTDKFLAMVSEGVVHCVYKVVTWSSFGVTRRHKASGGKWIFRHCVTILRTNLEW